MNNADRSQWIDNDKGLYNWWKSSRLSKAKFISQNRSEIDAVIERMTSGKERQHYLAYPSGRTGANHRSPFGPGA